MLSAKEREFILGLTKLTQETGIAIGGCGCCGSPYLVEAKFTSSASGYVCDRDGESVRWIDPSDEYDWSHYANSIIK